VIRTTLAVPAHGPADYQRTQYEHRRHEDRKHHDEHVVTLVVLHAYAKVLYVHFARLTRQFGRRAAR
jgi:hypothetical protein